MKIKNFSHIGKNSKGASRSSVGAENVSSDVSGSAESADAGDVSIGGRLGQLQQTLGTAKSFENQRAAVIQQAINDLRDGKLGTEEDFEQAVTALLQEL